MKRLFNDEWTFVKTAQEEAPAPELFVPVQVPHDWLIYDTGNLYETSFGHYRKTYDFGRVSGRSLRLYFEGVYMDSTIYLDGRKVCDWKYGYSSFEADLTPFLSDGVHVIDVLVRHRSPNSRWYSGAGIFRDVWLMDTEESHLVTDGVYFHAEPDGDLTRWKCQLSVQTVLKEQTERQILVSAELKDGSEVLYSGEAAPEAAGSAGGWDGRFSFDLMSVRTETLWDIQNPHLLQLSVCLYETSAEDLSSAGSTETHRDLRELDRITLQVGLRSAVFDPDKGFLLNGRRVKIQGVCLHHDLGCLGAAFNRSAARRQLLLMQEMGANAIRTSHNMPAVGLMELCDELGILVDSEAFDMWERPKTEYDYARFFDEWMERDVRSWICRDRNHPSVIMWSVGNEIYDTHASPRGREVAAWLHRTVRLHDPLGNAPTTIGSNYMQWEGAQNCAEEVDLAGYNYGERLYPEHHERYPGWCIYGSETTSGVKSRGVYHFPRNAAFLTHEDHQCSALGNCRAGASAETPEQVIRTDFDTEFSAGMFIWTGADYIGEPTPYSTRNAYFGNIDTAGLKKDSFYLYQAAWTKKPVLHLLPYWDFNPGQLVDVVAYTNLERTELFLNGESMGVCETVDHTAAWQIPYTPGEILVCGRTPEGEELICLRHSFGDSAALRMQADFRGVGGNAGSTGLKPGTVCGVTAAEQTDAGLPADGETIVAVEISAVDAEGYPVENARDRIRLSVTGGRLLGFDNGDSTDEDGYKTDSRRLFAGKAVAYIVADLPEEDNKHLKEMEGSEEDNKHPGNKEEEHFPQILVRAESDGIEPAELMINVLPGTPRKGICVREDVSGCTSDTDSPAEIKVNKHSVRKIELARTSGRKVTPESGDIDLIARVFPEEAAGEALCWSVVTDTGIVSNLAEVGKLFFDEQTGKYSEEQTDRTNGVPDIQTARLLIHGDGHFRVRCSLTNGTPYPEVISELEFDAEGFGQAVTDPYSFVRGGLYTDSIHPLDDVREGGVKVAGESNLVGFRHVDFGRYGTEHFSVRMINWFKDDPFDFALWLGRPGTPGAEKLGTYTYQANFIWQTYQEREYDLPRIISGMQDVYFEVSCADLQIDFGGFVFVPRKKAYLTLPAADTDLIRGDTFTVSGSEVLGIGNNVELDFEEMDFDRGTSEILLTGRTRHEQDSVHVYFMNDEGVLHREILEFPGSDEVITIRKPLPDLTGRLTVQFRFLPGCDFDFREFRIVPAEG